MYSLFCIISRLNGSYEALKSGKIQDALVDFTGGVGEVMSIQSRPADQLFNLMMDIEKMNTLMGSSISVSRILFITYSVQVYNALC